MKCWKTVNLYHAIVSDDEILFLVGSAQVQGTLDLQFLSEVKVCPACDR